MKRVLSFFISKIGVISRSVPYYYYHNHSKKIQIDYDDKIFTLISKQIINEGQTFLKHDRLYTLFQFLKQIPEETSVAEVGVYKGGSSKFMALVLKELNKRNVIFSCDTFEGHSNVDERFDGYHRVNDGFSDVHYDEVEEYLKLYNVKLIKGDIFLTLNKISPDKPLGLIHLDVDVYPATKFVLEMLTPKLVKGGVVVCDDYGFISCKGARKAVDEFLLSNTKNFKYFYMLTGQMIIVALA